MRLAIRRTHHMYLRWMMWSCDVKNAPVIFGYDKVPYIRMLRDYRPQSVERICVRMDGTFK